MPKHRYNSIANINPLNNSNSYSLNSVDIDIENNLCNYDFSNIKNKPISEIIKKIPDTAVRKNLIPTSNIPEGFEYKWTDNYYTWRIRFHCADTSVNPGQNASQGWIVRVQRGHHYMDSNGNFHSPGIYKKNSPNYNEDICNDTHIPVINDIKAGE